MNVIQVCGGSNSGKTTVIRKLIRILTDEGKSVAAIKHIHRDDFHIDQPGKDTFLHQQAGACPVVALGGNETDFLYSRPMSMEEIVSTLSADWLFVEGWQSCSLPRIVCAKRESDVDAYLSNRTIAVCGRFSGETDRNLEFPVYNPADPEQFDELIRLIKSEVSPIRTILSRAPYEQDFTDDTDMENGKNEAVGKPMKEQSKPGKISVKIREKNLPLNPFVERVLKNTIIAFLKELKGWKEGERIEVVIDDEI